MKRIDFFGKVVLHKEISLVVLPSYPSSGRVRRSINVFTPASGNIKSWLADTIPHLFYILEALRCEKDSKNDDELLLDAEEENLW